MLAINVGLSAEGRLSWFRASGHAGAGRGTNIVCAAATGLLRTAARLLWSVPGVVESGSTDSAPQMSLVVKKAWAGDPGWLRGVTDFLVLGLRDLQAEFPEEITLRIES